MVPLAPPPPPTAPLPAPTGDGNSAGSAAAATSANAPAAESAAQATATGGGEEGDEEPPPLIPVLLSEPGREVGFEETWHDRATVVRAMERAAGDGDGSGPDDDDDEVPVPDTGTLVAFQYELDDAVCPGLRIALPGCVAAAREAGARASVGAFPAARKCAAMQQAKQ